MVRFEKEKIVIEIASSFPANDWLERVRDIVYAIGAIDKDRVDNDHDCIYGLATCFWRCCRKRKMCARCCVRKGLSSPEHGNKAAK